MGKRREQEKRKCVHCFEVLLCKHFSRILNLRKKNSVFTSVFSALFVCSSDCSFRSRKINFNSRKYIFLKIDIFHFSSDKSVENCIEIVKKNRNKNYENVKKISEDSSGKKGQNLPNNDSSTVLRAQQSGIAWLNLNDGE